MVTVLDVLKGASDYLQKKQIESPRLNAEYLLAHVLGKKRIELYMEFDRPLSEAERAPMRELTRARGEGKPLQHLLGSVEFLGREFRCDARALIPRPETEQFVELTLKKLSSPSPRLLDVGTGSGVIAISLALALPESQVFAVDVSRDALDLAGENAATLNAKVTFLSGSLLEAVDGPFSAILANLPYIATDEIGTLSPEVRHDPMSALDGGPDGMDLIRKLVSSAPAALEPGGLLGLEIGSGQHTALIPVLEHHNFRDIHALPDYQGHIRFLFANHG